MKVITEAILRTELRTTRPDVYYIPEGKLLSPAAREYLNQLRVEIDFEKNKEKRLKAEAEAEEKLNPKKEAENSDANAEAAKIQSNVKYVDYETGASYFEKPEHMTQIFGNKLVEKSHPRIAFRGKLDDSQSEIVLAEAYICSEGKNDKVIKDLENILGRMREIVKCEVLDLPMEESTIIGLTHEELRAQSHDPVKYFGVEYMKLPDYHFGIVYSWLNKIRSSIREAEVLATSAFHEGRTYIRGDILEELNRLSSAMHIMMCRYLSGGYKE